MASDFTTKFAKQNKKGEPREILSVTLPKQATRNPYTNTSTGKGSTTRGTPREKI